MKRYIYIYIPRFEDTYYQCQLSLTDFFDGNSIKITSERVYVCVWMCACVRVRACVTWWADSNISMENKSAKSR